MGQRKCEAVGWGAAPRVGTESDASPAWGARLADAPRGPDSELKSLRPRLGAVLFADPLKCFLSGIVYVRQE